jgi:hypothetical protein
MFVFKFGRLCTEYSPFPLTIFGVRVHTSTVRPRPRSVVEVQPDRAVAGSPINRPASRKDAACQTGGNDPTATDAALPGHPGKRRGYGNPCATRYASNSRRGNGDNGPRQSSATVCEFDLRSLHQ